MPITHDNYDQLKIDKLKHYLEDMTAKGHAKPYEIFVDSLKVVPKTEDPKEFDNYEYYMNDDTEKIRIQIYNWHYRVSAHLRTSCLATMASGPGTPVDAGMAVAGGSHIA